MSTIRDRTRTARRRRPRDASSAGAGRGQDAAARADGLSQAQIAEIQRSRLLGGAVRAVDEFGYARVTVAHITRRARVSRRTFYELFANREECLAAVVENVVCDIREELRRAHVVALPWQERVRGALWVILAFLDREPARARVCVVQALRGGPALLERREEILGQLAAAVDEGRRGGARGVASPPLTAEGLVGAAFSIVHARLLRSDRQPLVDLLGELMGMIVLPYLGPAAARREQARLAPTLPLSTIEPDARTSAQAQPDPLESVNMRLTYRTARVLEAISEHPGISNRAVGERAGVVDQGQISKLLARLERLELIQNASDGGHTKGEPNAWTLTSVGHGVAQSIRGHARHDGERRAA